MKSGGVWALASLITVLGLPGPLQPEIGGLALRQATHELVHFLEVDFSLGFAVNATQQGRNQRAMPPKGKFEKKCISHTQGLVKALDESYTDLQIRWVAETECSMDKMFDTVEDGYDNYDACMKFAKLLSKARNMEVKNGFMDGYKWFCDFYYEHKTKKQKAKEKKKEEKAKEAEKKPIDDSQADTTTNMTNTTNDMINNMTNTTTNKTTNNTTNMANNTTNNTTNKTGMTLKEEINNEVANMKKKRRMRKRKRPLKKHL